MELSVTFDQPATLYHDDPATPCSKARMGDIVHLPSGDAQLLINVPAASPVRRIDLFNGLDHMECYRPYASKDLGNRIGVMWEGADYRGRFRAVPWDGSAHFTKAKVTSTQPVNFFIRDKLLDVSKFGLIVLIEWLHHLLRFLADLSSSSQVLFGRRA
jgi:hypothetical protein